jgi:V/A-type H+-transporting ATPase subunit D
MAHVNIPPTRSNLLRVKHELQFARVGYEILDRKREVLTTELIHLAHNAQELQDRVWKQLEEAYLALQHAKLTMGRERVEWAAMSVNKTVEVQLKFRGVMGVPIPIVDAQGEPSATPYSLADTTAALDEASIAFRRVLDELAGLSELVTSVWRLAGELRKTQRRVNALQHIFIPNYEETVAFIEAALEEHERQETFRLKLLKGKSNRLTDGLSVYEVEKTSGEIVDKGSSAPEFLR